MLGRIRVLLLCCVLESGVINHLPLTLAPSAEFVAPCLSRGTLAADIKVSSTATKHAGRRHCSPIDSFVVMGSLLFSFLVVCGAVTCFILKLATFIAPVILIQGRKRPSLRYPFIAYLN